MCTVLHMLSDDVVGGGCCDDVYDDDAHLLSKFFPGIWVGMSCWSFLLVFSVSPLSDLLVLSSSVWNLLFLYLLIRVCPYFLSVLSTTLLPLIFFSLLYSIFSLGIWGKQDGTSDCAWGWRGQYCSSPASGSPPPLPRCLSFLSFSLSLSLLTKNNNSI